MESIDKAEFRIAKEVRRMTTRADVAKLAGVSESTVSYVLSGKRPISEKTRARVLSAIEQSGYKSNYAASVLAGGSPRLVTMMISNLFTTPASRINGALVDGIVDGVKESGFHSVIWPVSNDDDSDVDLLLKSNFSGGVILMNVKENDQRLHLLNDQKIPFVVLGRTEVGFDYNYVDRDFDAVFSKALSELNSFGHRHVGVIKSGKDIPVLLKSIASSLKMKLSILDSSNTHQGGYELAKKLSASDFDYTAIVSLLDAATIGFAEASSKYSIRIPEDLSLIALNMLEDQAEKSEAKISTVAFEAYAMAESCGKMMVEIIESGLKGASKKHELWTGELVNRGSISQAKVKR